jgi:hypothetical protein
MAFRTMEVKPRGKTPVGFGISHQQLDEEGKEPSKEGLPLLQGPAVRRQTSSLVNRQDRDVVLVPSPPDERLDL